MSAKRWAIVVNEVGEVTADQTTWQLAVELVRRGHTVAIVGVADLSITPDGEIVANSARDVAELPPDPVPPVLYGSPRRVSLSKLDAVLVRTSPGRDTLRQWAHVTGLEILDQLARTGVVVANSPQALARFATKLSLMMLPAELRPPTLVSRDVSQIRAFAAEQPDGAVLKPLSGSRGAGVLRVPHNGFRNLAAIVELLAESGWVVAQSYVAEASAGDVRVLMVDGAPMLVDGTVAAIARVPSDIDFRSNIHAGGRAEGAKLSPEQLETCRRAGSWLHENGLDFVGLDLVGRYIIELNVFSPGGLADAERFTGKRYLKALVDHFERRVTDR